MCTFCTFLLPASWDAHLAREHWKNWGKSMNLLVNWRSIWVVSQRGAWFLRPVWEVKVSHGKTNTKRFKWKKWQRHIHMYRVTHVCTCASWAWDVRNVKGDDCLCTCATEQARKIYRWSVYTVCWLKSVVSCTNRSLEHVFFFLPYITCVTNLNANMNNSCCPNSTGCNKSKTYMQIFKVWASLRGKSQTFAWELWKSLDTCWCKRGTILVQGQNVGVLTGNLSYPLSPLSLPGPVCTVVSQDSCRLKEISAGFHLLQCHVTFSIQYLGQQQAPEMPHWMNAQGSSLNKYNVLTLHHWESVVCFIWLSACSGQTVDRELWHWCEANVQHCKSVWQMSVSESWREVFQRVCPSSLIWFL